VKEKANYPNKKNNKKKIELFLAFRRKAKIKSKVFVKQRVNIILSFILGRSWSSCVFSNREIVVVLTILLIIFLIAGATLLVYLYYQRVPKDGILICGGWSGNGDKDGENTCEVIPAGRCRIPDLDHVTGNNFLGVHIGENNQKVLQHIYKDYL